MAFLFSCLVGSAAWAGDQQLAAQLDRRHDDQWFWGYMQQQDQERQQRQTDWQNAQQREFDRTDAEVRHKQIMEKLEELEDK